VEVVTVQHTTFMKRVLKLEVDRSHVMNSFK
jgi:hypothetical protein